MMKKSTLEENDAVATTRNELEIHSRLRHPSIVRMRAYFQNPERLFSVLEYVEGCELFELMDRRGGRLEESVVRSFAAQLVDALGYLQQRNIIHRDIKPENLLHCDASGRVKLCDFGWAVHSREGWEDAQYHRSTTCGTLDYLAPEIVLAATEGTRYAEKVDNYAVGILIYELLVGRAPFAPTEEVEDEEEAQRATMRAIVSSAVDFPVEEELALSPDCRALIVALTQKSAAARPEIESVRHHPWLAQATAALAAPAVPAAAAPAN